MNVAVAIAGILILIVLLVEVLWTTMGIGGGFMTKWLAGHLHHLMLAVYWRFGNRLWLAWSGIVTVVLVFVLWVFLLWTGWTLIFMGGTTAVVNSTTSVPADFWERVYYVGFSIFTLGIGDFRSDHDLWRILTAVASIHGLFSVTFVITYLVPVVQAATQMRQLGVTIASLGISGGEILLNNWDTEQKLTTLGQYLIDLTPSLAQVEQLHLTYPVLHYFGNTRRSASLALRIAALDEALTILDYGFEAPSGLSMAERRPLRQVVTKFLHTLDKAYIQPHSQAPPPPDLDLLREQGLPVASNEVFHQRIAHLADRRRLLRGMVHSKGWRWDDVGIIDEDDSRIRPLQE